MKTELKEIISYEIEHVFGRRILSLRDCIELSDDIYSKVNNKLNPNTLRRFFHLIKAPHPPSKATLTILAQYCGFQSIQDIYKIKNTESFDSGNLNTDSVLYFLVSIFRDASVKDVNDFAFSSMMINIIKFLNSNKFLTDRFQSMIAKSDNAKYYYEGFINVDKLNSFYGNGLRYYLREKGTVDVEVFTSWLYIFKYWLSGEDEKLIKNMEILQSINYAHDLHPYTKIRHLSSLLFYNHVMALDNEKTVIEMHNVYQELIGKDVVRKNLYSFLFIISVSLFLVGYAEDSVFFINESKKISGRNTSQSDQFEYAQLYLLIESYALHQNGENKKATMLFEQIKATEFPFLSRKFATIIYLLLQKRIRPSKSDARNEQNLQTLIDDTGFKKLINM